MPDKHQAEYDTHLPAPSPGGRVRRGARAAAGALVALALGFASLLHAAETTVSQFAAGATWSLHGETSPVPGGTYTYTITRTAGPQPDNEYAGFYVPSTSTSVAHSNLGSNPMSCGAGKYFCASFSPSRGPGIWNNIQGHHTIYTEIYNNTTITATLAVTADTPIGTTISFGAIESNGRPRSGGLLLTVSTAPTKPPDPTPPTLVSATTKTLTIEWTHPGDGGSPLVRDYVHYRVQGTTEWSNWYAGETPVTRAAIGGLQANTAYDVRVSVTNARGSSEWVMGATAFSTRANTPATGAPTITGTAGVGQVLTASTTSIADADGLPATFSYQWVRVDADGTSNPVDIPAATDASYTLTAPDVGKKVKVKVSFTDDLETTETLTSDAYPSGGTVTAAATCPVPDFAGRRKIWTAVLTMGDFTTQGSPLRGYGRFPDAGGDGGGLDPATFTIGLNEYAVEELAVDAIRLYFSLPLRAIWRTPATAALRLHVCNAPYDFSDSHYAWDGRSNVIPEHAWDTALDWSSVSTRTVHLSLPDNRSATGALGITGTAEVGQVLGVDVTGIEDEDGLYDVEYAYQWVRVDADGTSNPVDILGETTATYTLTDADEGKRIRVKVSFTDDLGNQETLTSEAYPASGTVLSAIPPPPSPPPGDVVGYLENPGPHSFQSGIGVISGWVCEAEEIVIELTSEAGEGGRFAAGYGTERRDTQGECGDTDNGFGLLFNWNLLGDGTHSVVALVDGLEWSRTTVTVTTLGEEFVRGAEGECLVPDFPLAGETALLTWQQNSQNFVIAEGTAPAGTTNRAGLIDIGFLENPGHNSFQSGVRVISGWVCDADTVELAIGTAGRQGAAYGTERLDTLGVCGDTDNGFGLLFNWNLLGDGEHTVVAWVDGIELGRATVRVTTLGAEFLRDVEGECVVEDFPMPGETVLLEWQQNSQNFVITDME